MTYAPPPTSARLASPVHPLKVSGLVRFGDQEVHVINYAYLVVNDVTGQALIVDPAWELETIEAAIQAAGVTLSAILLTHSHFDHVNLVTPLVARHGAEVWMSREEIHFYRFDCPNLRAIEGAEPFLAAGLRVIPYFTPGHTKGSTCFRVGDNLFSGDTLFTEGCGVCIGKGAEPREMFESIQAIKGWCPPQVRVFPGHSFGESPGKTFGELLHSNIYLSVEEYELFHSLRMRSSQKRIFDFR
jgi:hydroxyacylglutathione hydrolase